MDILNSLFVSVFGMTVVFFALILLIVMINVMSFALKRSHRQQAQPAAAAVGAEAPLASLPAAEPSAPVQPPMEKTAGSAADLPQGLKLTNVDEKTAAIIMAIVCDDSGIPLNELYFKSIRLLNA